MPIHKCPFCRCTAASKKEIAASYDRVGKRLITSLSSVQRYAEFNKYVKFLRLASGGHFRVYRDRVAAGLSVKIDAHDASSYDHTYVELLADSATTRKVNHYRFGKIIVHRYVFDVPRK